MHRYERRLLRRRREYEETKAENREPCPDLEEFCDIPYADDGAPAHRMDIFRPASNSDLPVVLHIHGGGLCLGSREDSRNFCAELSRQGFLVCNVEYSLAPEAYTYQQLAEISRAMRTLETILPEYGGDCSRFFLTGDDAGALLAVYTAAIQQSEDMAECANVTPPTLSIQALGLICGLFYTCRKGKIFVPRTLWGPFYKHCDFTPYTNPEHPAILGSLPPCYLSTSGGDSERQHVLDFAEALTGSGIPCEIDSFPDRTDLTHDFPVLQPSLPESQIVLAHLAAFFRKQAEKTPQAGKLPDPRL